MKKHFLQRKGQTTRPHYPFWKPWGIPGCFGRVLAFLLMLIAFTLLLMFLSSIPRSCSGGGDNPVPVDSIPMPEVIDDEIINIPDSVGDNPYGNNQPVTNPPYVFEPDPGDIIENPDRPGMIDGKHLFVIVDRNKSQATSPLQRFVSEFQSLYPNCKVEAVEEHTQMVLLAVPQEQREQIRKNLPSQITDVEFYIDVIEIFQTGKAINEPAMRKREFSWHLQDVKAPEGWDITTGSPDVKVAVIDDYFDLTHPEFVGLKIEKPISFEKGTGNVLPPGAGMETAHGTHVLGLIAAQMNNGIGTSGVAPNVTIIPISLGKAMNSFTIIEGVLYALYNGANVINASLGHLSKIKMPIERQVEIWKRDGKRLQSIWNYVSDMLDRNYCTIVWASGNENLFEMMDFAKRSPSVIRVDAVDSSHKKAFFSNFGNFDININGQRENIRSSQISAPGVDVVSTVPGRRFAAFAGTSMAAPIVTGAVALMKSIDPTLSNKDIIDILKKTGKKLSNDSIGPLLQIRPALDAVKKNLGQWDQFKADPTRGKGIWKKANQSTYVDSETGEFRYYGQDYMIFESRAKGIFEVHKIGDNLVYNARFNANWGENEVILEIIPPLEAPNTQSGISTRKIRLFKDKDGSVGYRLLSPINNNVDHMKWMEKDDRVNTNKRPI